MKLILPRIVKPSWEQIRTGAKGLGDARAWLEYQDKLVVQSVGDRVVNYPYSQAFYNSASDSKSPFDKEVEKVPALKDRVNPEIMTRIKQGYAKVICALYQKKAGLFKQIDVRLDLICLENIIERICGGDLIGEAKLQEAVKNGTLDKYLKAIKAKDIEKLKVLLVHNRQQTTVLTRIAANASAYALAPQSLQQFYNQQIMPLTLQREAESLARRDLSDLQ